MKTYFSLIVAVFVLSSGAGALESLSPHGVLEKASRRLRQNQLPSAADYLELENAIASERLDDFMDKKVLSYAQSDRFAYGMTFRLLEDFEVLTSGNLGRDVWNSRAVPPYGEREDAMTRFFFKLMKENQSWDRLLTGTSYEVPFYETALVRFQGRTDPDFLKEVLGDLVPATPATVDPLFIPRAPRTGRDSSKPIPPQIKQLNYPERTPFLAGAVTTNRFFERYTNVALNKNRRRAAALFKIFLCDPMVPAIDNSQDKKHEYLARAFPKDWTLSVDDIRARLKNSDADIHGRDAQCFSCHYKLDPAGQTFQAIGLNLSRATNPGALIYKSSQGTKIDVPVSSINDLGHRLTEQDDYVTCQVRKFWKWFVGTDVPLDDSRLQQLARIFNHMNHQPQDFAAYLTRTEEFRRIPRKAERIAFSTVRPLLTRCDSCHHGVKNKSGEGLPQFAFAYAQLLPEHGSWLLKMKERMSRSDHLRMPMDWQAWKDDDLATVKSWVQQSIDDLSSEAK